MDELVVADVDADVRIAPAKRIEEDQIAGRKRVPANRQADTAHRFRLARQAHAKNFAEDDRYQAAAVESQRRIVAARAVGNTDQADRADDQVRRAAGGACGLRDALTRRSETQQARQQGLAETAAASLHYRTQASLELA